MIKKKKSKYQTKNVILLLEKIKDKEDKDLDKKEKIENGTN